MVITDRIQADNTPRVTPIINKRSSNVRLSTSYDTNCDSNSRINDHISEQSLSSMSVNLNHSVDYLNVNSLPMKKDRINVDSNSDGRNTNNIRLCNSQSNDVNKPDSLNRQFSPWSAPVRNRVVARVVPYPHTSSNAPNVSHLNTNITSKSNQNIVHSIRSSNSSAPQNVNRNIHKVYNSYQEKDIQMMKQDKILSINPNFLHLINARDSDPLKRRPNYNQQVTYRVKNPDGTPKSFDVRNSSFTTGHNVKSRNYRFSDLPEVIDKPVTAAEVFGEDFSDLSDNDSTPSYASPPVVSLSNNRKRKPQMLKCKSPSSDSSSTISVLSAEKQNRFVRVSKPHFNTIKSSLHVKSINRNKKPVKLKSSSSSDEQRNTIHNSKVNRHQIKFSIQEKSEKKNISMKPLTVNVSLSNFEDNVLESDETSSRNTEISSENSSKVAVLQKGSLNMKNKQSPLQVSKRKLILDTSQKYRNEDHHLSSSSDNDSKDYGHRRFQISSNKSKPYILSEHENRKVSKYILDRTYKENTSNTKLLESNSHKIKVDNDHHSRRKMSYNSSSHNFIVERQYHEKDSTQGHRDKNSYIQRRHQRSNSPPIKRQKINHESNEKDNIHRSFEKNMPISSQAVNRQSLNKHQKVRQELSSDAVFQKEFDEFKRDQAGDISQGSASRKCNSSVMSSASSTGIKSFSSFKKFKSKKQDSSSKYSSIYDPIDSKNIFQIDMSNINIYESMYDKVKRRAQKQAESKITQHSSDISEQRSKRKSKTSIKHSSHTLKDNKSYHKRYRKSREKSSPSSSVYSGNSSPLVDDSISTYSSTIYPAINKNISNEKSMSHSQRFYKSSKSNAASSFDSPSSYSLQNWKRKENQEKLFLMHKNTQKYKSEIKQHKIKNSEHDFNDNEEHENNSEFSYITNVSNVINIPNKSNHEYKQKESEEIGNGSDGTASTEPMEYAEVDLESLKLSDDDWKSGLSSQSSSESGAAISTTDQQKTEITHMNKICKPVSVEKKYSPVLETHSVFCSEPDIHLEIIMKKEEIVTEGLNETNYTLENDLKETEACSRGIEIEESAKEEQDIAIASIMLKEENECKSPIDWESRSTGDVNLISDSVTSIFVVENKKESNISEDNNTATNTADILNDQLVIDFEKLEEEKMDIIVPSLTEEAVINAAVCASKPDSSSADEILPVPEPIVFSPVPVVKVDSMENNSTLDVTMKEYCIKNTTALENIIERPVSTSDSSLPDNSSVSNPVVSLGLKSQYTNKGNNITSPTDKEHLTSYVKSVIERVMQEQSVENQNKLKFDRCMSKRNKRASGSSTVLIKPTVTSTNVVSSTPPVSLSMPLQKSPSVSYQAVVIENTEVSTSSCSITTTGTTPSIPGVNVCSPVVTTTSNINKSTTDVIISSISSDSSVQKQILTRSNVISIINLSSGTPTLKVDPLTTSISSSSELKINTDLTSLSSIVSDVSSVLTDTNSTNTPISQLKSPNSDDQIKQRICTRLRRADPNKSDGNYKVVMTISTNKTEHFNLNSNDKSSNADVGNKESNIKQQDEEVIPVEEVKQPDIIKVADPYEPNFDESPLELSHYRTRTKKIFFPVDTKSSVEECITITSIPTTVPTVKPITTVEVSSTSIHNPVSSVIDSVSQVIEDVAHGHFNYNEYLSCFKYGRLPSLQISPSTTPLTFVSNDSRDCSSVSVDNQNNGNTESGPITHRKGKHNIDDGKKSNSSQKHAVTVFPALSVSLDTSAVHMRQEKTNVTNNEANFAYTSRNAISNVSISPICSTSINPQYNKDILALLNQAVLYRPVESNSQAAKFSVETSNKPEISSVQIQPFNILSNSSEFDKNAALNNKFHLKTDSNSQKKITKVNLINTSQNSEHSSINAGLSSTVQSAEEKMAIKQFYLNFFQQRNNLAGIDQSALSQLQSILNEAQSKQLNHNTDNNLYRMSQSVSNIESSAMSSAPNVSNQEPNNSLTAGVTQNISSKFIADIVIPREYPLVWEGKLSLKNEEAKVALHFVYGNSELLNACMHLLIFSGSLQWNNTGSLKIVQRMRLDTSQLEGVQRRMQNSNEYCIGLALPGGDDTAQWMRQSQILKEGFIKYMREKGAAGIINVCHPNHSQQGLYVVHIFPPCEFSDSQLCATAPQLATIIDNQKIPSLLVIITTV